MKIPALNIVVSQIIEPGGGVPYALCNANPDRAFIVINPTFVKTNAFICLSIGKATESFFDQLLVNVPLAYIRNDMGSLVTCELYFCDLFGNSPGITMTITEGIIIRGLN